MGAPPALHGQSRLDAPRALALLRMLVSFVVLGSSEVWHAPLLVEPLDVPSPGASSIAVSSLALSVLGSLRHPAPVEALRAIVLAAAAMTFIGMWTRASSIFLAVTSCVLLGLVQTQGTPLHIHHLWWLAAVVAAAPSGAAWSLDAWRRRAGAIRSVEPAAEAAAEAALRWACVVLALVYFFPGLHKLVDAGSPFLDGSALARLVRLKALEAGREVPFGLDGHPLLLVAGGVAVAVAEVVCGILALWRPRLGFFVVAGLHASFFVVLDMPYTVLSVFSFVFLLARSRGLRPMLPRPLPSEVLVVVLVAAALVIGIAAAGVRGDLRSYPFACYPTFSVPVPTTILTVEVEIEREGRFAPLPHDVVVPDDLRSAVVFASRQIASSDDARVFLAHRAKDERFCAAVADASRLRVVASRRDLGVPGAPVVARRELGIFAACEALARCAGGSSQPSLPPALPPALPAGGG